MRTYTKKNQYKTILYFFFVQVIRLYFYPVDMRSKYTVVNTGRVRYS